jgi:hypothetical protein
LNCSLNVNLGNIDENLMLKTGRINNQFFNGYFYKIQVNVGDGSFLTSG